MTLAASANAVADVVRASSFLHAGRIFVADVPHAVTTILGSCVAVCLWDESTRVGGLNHFLLPDFAGLSDSPKYGVAATRMLIEQVCRAGAQRRRLRAKVFGGAAMTDMSHNPIGPKNVALAVQELAAQAIPIVAQDTCGARGRKVIFQTDDGTALVKLL